MDRGWMPRVSGILSIVAGGISLLVVLVMAIVCIVFATSDWRGMPMMRTPVWLILAIVFGALIIIKDIVCIVGGVFAIRKKAWGMALAGSIAAVIPYWPLGVAAIVFIALSRGEFKTKIPTP